MGSLVKVSFKLSATRRRFLNQTWTPENGRAIMQIVEDELSLTNFPDVWLARQASWAPLTRPYERWKNLNYPGRKKWEMTGATLAALKTPARLTTAGGVAGAKKIALDHSRKGVIVATYDIVAPAAGGFFYVNNDKRPIWDLMPYSHERILDKGNKYLGDLLKKGLGTK